MLMQYMLSLCAYVCLLLITLAVLRDTVDSASVIVVQSVGVSRCILVLSSCHE